MKRTFLTVLLLVTFAFAYPTSAPCPIDGQDAPYTGHYKEVFHADGKHILCEYSHAANMGTLQQTVHRFWADCTHDF